MGNNILYENLALSGGGAKGITFIGALRKLQEDGILQNMTRFAGSSAGALCAACLACNGSLDQIDGFLRDIDPSMFNDHGCGGIVRKVYNIFRHNGVYKTDKLYQWCQDSIEKLTGNKDITFEEVFLRYNHELVITGTLMNPKSGETVYFSRHTGFENMKICQAMIISISIPFYFFSYKYQDGVYSDGGLLDYIPLHIFDRKLFSGNDCNNIKSLGISLQQLTHTEEISPPYYQELIKKNNKPSTFFNFVSRTINSIYSHAQWSYEETFDAERIIQVYTPNISLLDFDLSTKTQNTLIEQGYQETTKYLLNRSKNLKTSKKIKKKRRKEKHFK